MIRYDMIRYDMIWYDMIWYDMIWYDMIWYGMIWYDMIQYNTLRYDTIWVKTYIHTTRNVQYEADNVFPSGHLRVGFLTDGCADSTSSCRWDSCWSSRCWSSSGRSSGCWRDSCRGRGCSFQFEGRVVVYYLEFRIGRGSPTDVF